MTRRRSRKEKNKEVEETNGVDSQDVTNEDSQPETNNEPKKRKSEKGKKGSPSKTKKEVEVEDAKSESEDDDDDTQYEVEEVIDEKMVRGVRHYLIRWKGYDEDGDTWEPEGTLDCPDLVKKFKEQQKLNDENETPKKGKKGKNAEDDSETEKERKKSKQKGRKRKSEEKSSKKSKEQKLPDVDWESGDEFEVDRILDVYFKKNGKREFLVSWKGYPHSQDSWEPEENLECGDLIEKFMSKVEQAKMVDHKELRLHRTPTERFTLNMYSGDGSRRLSRRLGNKQRVQYHDAE